jgi:DNA-binding CsgD family transcriptional regulator
MAAYGTEVVVEERVLYALSRGHLAAEGSDGVTPQALSRREMDVLRCLCRGLHTEELAPLLGISPHTADTHVRNLLKKLQVSSRVDAVGWAIRTGVYDPTTGHMRVPDPTEP